MQIQEISKARQTLSIIINHPLLQLVLGIAFVVGTMALCGYFLNVTGYDTKAFALKFGQNKAVFIQLIILAVSGFIGYVIFVKLIERRRVTEFGGKGAFGELLMGLLIGTALMSATIGIMWLLGVYKVTGFGVSEKQWLMVAMGLGPGIYEEILMRGLLFRLTEKWLGSWAAIGISALVFGLMHLPNDNATLFSSIAIALEAGVLLAAVYMVTRRLWAVIGLHAAWNYVQGGVFNVAVSGNPADGLIKGHVDGSELVTGGIFGAEASIIAIILCTAAGAYALWIAHKRGQFISPSWHRFKTGQAAPA